MTLAVFKEFDCPLMVTVMAYEWPTLAAGKALVTQMICAEVADRASQMGPSAKVTLSTLASVVERGKFCPPMVSVV